jgi:hypothetical protein
LALPEQQAMPLISAEGTRRRETCTGAAATRLSVNTPAALPCTSLARVSLVLQVTVLVTV